MKFNIYKIKENKREKHIKSEKGNFCWKEDYRSKPSQNRWKKERPAGACGQYPATRAWNRNPIDSLLGLSNKKKRKNTTTSKLMLSSVKKHLVSTTKGMRPLLDMYNFPSFPY